MAFVLLPRGAGFLPVQLRAPGLGLLLVVTGLGCSGGSGAGPRPAAPVPPSPATPPPPPPAPPTPPAVAEGGEDTALLPTRHELLDGAFAFGPNSNNGTSRLLDFPTLRRAQQYGFLGLPQAPVFTAYHPLNPDDGSLRGAYRAVQTTLNVKLPASFREVLPAPLLARLQALGARSSLLDIFVVSQDQPWTGVPLCFRPHTWTDQAAPWVGNYNAARQVQVGLFEAPAGVHFSGRGPQDFFEAGISVHPGENRVIVSSPDNLHMVGLDFHHSLAFWSLTRSGDRFAATLHLLLNDDDQAALAVESLRANTIGELLRGLEGSRLGGTPVLAKFKALFRPVIHGAVETPLRGGEAELLVHGSGFTGVTAVFEAGVPARAVQVLDDAHLVAVLPRPLPGSAGRSRTLRLAGAMGAGETSVPPLAAGNGTSGS